MSPAVIAFSHGRFPLRRAAGKSAFRRSLLKQNKVLRGYEAEI
jgi:hypothetical protein